jgi:hypothetical protein
MPPEERDRQELDLLEEHAARTGRPRSGMYAAVPSITPTPVIMAGVVIVGDIDMLGNEPDAGSIAFARPKSGTLTVPSSLTLIFAGLRSRWVIPCS